MTSDDPPTGRPDPSHVERGGYTGSDKKTTGIKRPRSPGDAQDTEPTAKDQAPPPQD